MKKIFNFSLQLFAITNLIAQSTEVKLPFYESFDYPIKEKLLPRGTPANTLTPGRGSWVYSEESTSQDPIIVTQPWTDSKDLPVCKGNAIQFKAGKDDPSISFTRQAEESGSVYASFLFRINSWSTSEKKEFFQTWVYQGTQHYFTAFANSEIEDWIFSKNDFFCKLFFNRDYTDNGFTLGISDSYDMSKVVYHPQRFELGKDILIVVRYSYDKHEGTSYMWIDPKITSEVPLSAVNTLNDQFTDNKLVGRTLVRRSVNRFVINKSSRETTPDITLDEIRIANSWHEVVGKPNKIPLSKIEISNLKVYPNSIHKDKLLVDASEKKIKQVEISDLLGNQIFLAETKDKEILVPTIEKGSYVLKITDINSKLFFRLNVN